MAAANDGSEAEEARRQEELAKKLAQLSDEKRQKYEVHVHNAIDAHGTASHDYRLGLAKTFLQGLPPSEEGRQISDYNDRERKRAYADAQRLERAQTGRDQAAPEPTSGRQPEPAAPALDPMQGVRANGPQRDYGKLQKTQDEAAQRSQSPDAATAVLSRQQLQEMSERYAEVRKAGNLQPTPPELRERNDLAKRHSLIAEKMDRAHGTPDAQLTQQRALLDHQHLAERVGVEARLIGQRLRNQSVPGADIYEREGRSALHTARVLHQQRQNLVSGIDRAQQGDRLVQRQDEQKQADAPNPAQQANSLSVTPSAPSPAAQPQAGNDGPTRPPGLPRDGTTLQRTHENVASMGGAESEMQRILERYDALRRVEGITPGPRELAQRRDVTLLHHREEGVLEQQQQRERCAPAYQGEQAKWIDGQHHLEQSVIRVMHRASQVAVEGDWLARQLAATNKPEAERCRQEARLGVATAQEARQQRKQLRYNLAFIYEPDIFPHPGAELVKPMTDAERLNSWVEARDKHDRLPPTVMPERLHGILGRYDSIDPRAEHGVEATAPAYKFDGKTEAYIAAEVKGMDAHLANDPALRLDLAFRAHIEKGLDPKGPPFETFEGSGALDDERRRFYAKHPSALPRSQEPPAHVREAEDRKSAEQESTKGGRPLTTAERGNASAQAKVASERKDRETRNAETIRGIGGDGRGGGPKGRGGHGGGRGR